MDIRAPFGSLGTCTALLLAGLALLIVPASASAFDVPSFTVTPSTTQAGGHPNLTVQIERTGTADEDIRDLYLDLPPGLIGNTTAVGACTDAQFNSDTCPANSAVGSVTAVADAVGLFLPPTEGTIYNLVPGPTEPGAIGIVLRPTGAGLVFAPVFIRGTVAVQPNGPNDVNLQNVVLNQPRQVFLLPLLGLPVPVDITVNSMTLTLNGAGTLAPNTYFLTNPTSCIPAVSKARVVSYLDQEVTKESSFTPTGCESVPFDPFFGVSFDPTTVGAATAPTTLAGTPADQHPLSQAHVKTTSILFPYSEISLDFVTAGRLPACPNADLANLNCPAYSALGTVSATVPVIDPPQFTGALYRTNRPGGAFFTVAVILNGPRGVKTVVHGQSEFQPFGTAFVFPSQPQVPLTSLTVELTKKIYINRTHCGTKTIPATFIAHSGATAEVSDTFKTNGLRCEYARPKAATPVTVALVPAFKQCTAANATHGAPLSSASCSPPVPSSNYLTVGTPDAPSGNPATSNGEVVLKTVGESPIDPANGDQSDVQINASLSDVRNASDQSDYTGELRLVLPLRITDRYNEFADGIGDPLDSSATVTPVDFGVTMGCAATGGTEGSDCNVATSADAVMTDVVREGKRATWRLGQIQVFDGGADGDADTTGDNTLFAVQGTFTP